MTGVLRRVFNCRLWNNYILLLDNLCARLGTHVTWGRGKGWWAASWRDRAWARRPLPLLRIREISHRFCRGNQTLCSRRLSLRGREVKDGHSVLWQSHRRRLVKQGDHRGALLRMSAGWGRGEARAGAAGLQGPTGWCGSGAHGSRVAAATGRGHTCAADFNPDIFVGKHPPAAWSISPEALRKCSMPTRSLQPILLRQGLFSFASVLGCERFLKESSGRSVFSTISSLLEGSLEPHATGFIWGR